MKVKKVKVVFDTNVWISFIIGKRLSFLNEYISNEEITIIYCNQLLDELREVTARPKLKKYFPKNEVEDMIALIEAIGERFEFVSFHQESRDPKDNFLLDLIDISKSNYLVTGDKDLIVLNPFKSTKILSPINFEKEMMQ